MAASAGKSRPCGRSSSASANSRRRGPGSRSCVTAGPRPPTTSCVPGRAASRSVAQLGAGLAAAPQLVRLHLVAHSAGAYLLDPLCEPGARRADAAPATRVRMTFLDPIGLRGLFDRGWGARELGRCADVAEAYINTDDAAPATDRRLRHARTVDVTPARGRRASRRRSSLADRVLPRAAVRRTGSRHRIARPTAPRSSRGSCARAPRAAARPSHQHLRSGTRAGRTSRRAPAPPPCAAGWIVSWPSL
jgi:hypothetical protein